MRVELKRLQSERNLQQHRQHRGRAWEAAVAKALRSMHPQPVLVHKLISGGQGTPCDYLVVSGGESYGIECKRILRGHRLPYSQVTVAERQGLEALYQGGIQAYILIYCDTDCHAYAVPWIQIREELLAGSPGSILADRDGLQLESQGMRITDFRPFGGRYDSNDNG